MAAYNAEAYLKEAVDSLCKQTIGFDTVQLILVDDGSTDQTGTLCDTFASQFSNILALHKENGGAASARNFGLPHTKGRFLNFMDADDNLSPETLEHVYDFFTAHENETDVTVIPMIFFDGQNEEHKLNFYKKETCVADLEKHPEYVAMSMSSAFIRADMAKNIHFDERLSYAEDARVLQSLLLQKKTLGIVSEAVYWYRRHGSGSVSATQNTRYNPAWYQPYLDYFCMDLIRECLDKEGAVPAFVQHTLAYDLQLRLKVDHIPASVMDEKARERYMQTLFEIYTYIDDAVILWQKHTFAEQKLFVLSWKHKAAPSFVKKKNNIQLMYGDTKVYALNRSLVTIDFIKIKGTRCSIEGTINYFPSVMHEVTPYLLVNGKKRACRPTDHNEEHYCLDHLVLKRQGFIGRFDIDPNDPVTEVQFMYIYDDMRVVPFKYKFGKFVPIDTTFPEQYGCIGNYTVQYQENALRLEEATPQSIEDKEALFLSAVRGSGLYSEEDISLRTRARLLQKKSAVWLICDRYDQAGDNGEAFFRYLRKFHRFAVKPYFVLAEGSQDRARMEKIGPVVTYGSQEHKLWYLLSKYVISSHADDFLLYPFPAQEALYKDITAMKPVIYLQHGVQPHNISSWMNRYQQNFYGIVTSSPEEQKTFFEDPAYGYEEQNIWLTGMPRFDLLRSRPARQIAVLPTWRRSFLATMTKDKHWVSTPDLEKSAYVKFYHDLLCNEQLQDAAKEYGYTLCFKLHPHMEDFSTAFDLPATVQICGSEISFREFICNSDLLLTDYSSVAFDFAYLHKPVLYCQPDQEEFFSGSQGCSKGWFSYDTDVIGDIFQTPQEAALALIGCMKQHCTLQKTYISQLDKLFAFHDRHACRRLYKRIKNDVN